MAIIWKFRTYVSPDGTDEIRKWHDAQSAKVRARFLSRMRILATLPFNEWHQDLYKALHGNGVGLGEIRFKADNVQQRPLGFRSGESEFIILLWAIEKSNKFLPRDACEIALARKSEVQKGSKTNALWLALQ